MIYNSADTRLEEFVLDSCWEDFPEEVKERALTCTVDLLNALILGTQSKQFAVGLDMVKSIFKGGETALIGSRETLSTTASAIAMGHSSNAYDIDDGHNIIRAHPGTSFIGALLAVAYEQNSSYKEFLTALIVCYEVTIRMGIAIMDFYDHPHSSGTFGSSGTAVAVARLRKYSVEQLKNILSIAEFHAPLVPGSRSVAYPSMNKDGVPFGVIVGMVAAAEHEHAFEGSRHLLESEDYAYLLDDLGKNYEIMNLYFKPYSCCRWVHPALEAVKEIVIENKLDPDSLESITLHTFERAIGLSKEVPTTPDEAQYNIAYPVAAMLLWGDVGMDQLNKEAFEDPRIPELMKKISYSVDPQMEERFPLKRQCRAVIKITSGSTFTSSLCEPIGEADEMISLPWVEEKFRRMCGFLLTSEEQEEILSLLIRTEGSIRDIVDTVNNALLGE